MRHSLPTQPLLHLSPVTRACPPATTAPHPPLPGLLSMPFSTCTSTQRYSHHSLFMVTNDTVMPVRAQILQDHHGASHLQAPLGVPPLWSPSPTHLLQAVSSGLAVAHVVSEGGGGGRAEVLLHLLHEVAHRDEGRHGAAVRRCQERELLVGAEATLGPGRGTGQRMGSCCCQQQELGRAPCLAHPQPRQACTPIARIHAQSGTAANPAILN